MIVSKLSYRFAFKILAIFVFLNFFIASFCTNEKDYPHKGEYTFNLSAFFTANIVLIILCIILFLIKLSSKRRIVITDEKIIVQSILSSKSVEFLYSEISGLNWNFRNSSISGRGGFAIARSTTQNICVSFQDESELPISNYEYTNYDELRDFFYTYCKKNHLIEETSGQIRKKRRKSLLK